MLFAVSRMPLEADASSHVAPGRIDGFVLFAVLIELVGVLARAHFLSCHDFSCMKKGPVSTAPLYPGFGGVGLSSY